MLPRGFAPPPRLASGLTGKVKVGTVITNEKPPIRGFSLVIFSGPGGRPLFSSGPESGGRPEDGNFASPAADESGF